MLSHERATSWLLRLHCLPPCLLWCGKPSVLALIFINLKPAASGRRHCTNAPVSFASRHSLLCKFMATAFFGFTTLVLWHSHP
ncbi:hypothetical protein FB567DRAFT_290341 [Paraphoma chrysanthemicola]|uniref:Uncharacterized protein n=1 Tax=Paraphoma chrysanthemicola TaxID=798071 RepID=A0A8K0W141_9PLEO|nr:hypothetical protein FB567DRAFT_290341 [Paraphoma chrysanthemicola]